MIIRSQTLNAGWGFDEEGDYVTFYADHISVRCYLMTASVAQKVVEGLPAADDLEERPINVIFQGHIPSVSARCSPAFNDWAHPVNICLADDLWVSFLLPKELADKLTASIKAAAEVAKAYA